MIAPYLTLKREDAGQREHSLREVFNGLFYIVKTGAPWRWMPNDLPPWAGHHRRHGRYRLCRSGLYRRTGSQCRSRPYIRLEVIKPPEAKRGFVLLPRRWVVERSIAGASEGCAWRAPVAWSRFALKVSAAFKELP
ncbi:transposase [Novosphingobium sp. MD-1]|uniref:transposase n=1 Tax=Novosphingobium sp. MD-1 TaxID=1630648 RepID=UPI0035D0690D